jgi:DNA polymerase-3 subunit gamma/tau
VAPYVVLARKWRPAQFSDIVGQTHVVRTLMNAIKSERVHQAYLMTGSRGIGKTSIARIFAKAVRCPNTEWKGEGKDQWLASCGECPSCREIASGSSVDVIEIDGASNNGVDAVREIRENAKYLPASGGRKIYIIDEVHMLTTAAFNALLKTLEEPPAHVIFIFATTEPHKIPATILSRCQRFDLRRVTVAQIQERLAQVLQAEKIEAEAGAVALVARAAEGSMRDGMSLLDQVIAYSGERITTQAARESIGLIEGQTLITILRGIFARKPLDALAAVDQAYQQGHDLRVLARSLVEFLYGAILVKLGAAGSTSLELSSDEWKELGEIAPLRELEEMELIFQALHQGIEWIARSPQPKIVLDVLLIKCATAEALVSLDGSPSSPSGGGSGPGPGLASSAGRTPSTGSRPAPMAMGAGPAMSPASGALRSTPPGVVPAPSSAAVQASAAAETTAPASSSPPAVNPATGIRAALAASASAPAPAARPSPLSSARPAAVAPAPVAAAPVITGPRSFEGFITHVRRTRPLLATFLEHAHCDGLPVAGDDTQDTLSLCFQESETTFRDQLQSRTYSEQLNVLGKEYFGRAFRVAFKIGEVGESPAVRRHRARQEAEAQARAAATNHPIIAEARALFGGELGPIELIEGNEEGGSHATA